MPMARIVGIIPAILLVAVATIEAGDGVGKHMISDGAGLVFR